MSTSKIEAQRSLSNEGQPLVTMRTIWKLRLRQTLAASGPIVATLGSGMTSGFSAILLPQLVKDTSDIKIEPHESSWIASAAVIPMGIGSLISGLLMEQYGRRVTQLLVCTISFIGWIFLFLANKVWMIYIGRVLTGVCVGILGPPSIVYISETSDPRFRGVVVAGIPLAVACGIWCSHGLGSILDWKTVAAVCSIFPITGYFLLLSAPESPVWLVSKDKLTKAEEAFRWLRGYSESATKEMIILLNKQRPVSAFSKLKFDIETLKLVLDPSFLRPFFIINIFFFIQQFSGVNAVIFYSISILNDISSNVNEYLSTFIIDLIRVVMSFIACILLKKVPRRVLAIVSAFGTAQTLFLLSFSRKYLSSDYSWVNLLAIILYTCFISIGIVPLPWVMIGEVYPSSLRELGSAISSCFGFLVFFIVVKTSPYLISTWAIEGAFIVYGTIAFLGSIFLYFCLPETMNKTLQEIEDGFKNRASCQDTEVNRAI